MWLAVLAGALLVAAAAGGIAFAVSRGGSPEAGGVCTVKDFPAQGSSHVPPAKMPKGFEYNSYPPTSGPHHPQTLVFADYARPVGQNHLLHNLEHGAVGVQYGPDVSDETVRQLIAWYRNDPRGLIVAPLPDTKEAAKLRDRIVLTAWTADREDPDDPQSRITRQQGHLATCSRFDEEAFSDFLDDYRARGPELFPLEALAPGSP